jgi:hypothetical protein
MNPVLTRFGALALALVLATSLAACDPVNNTVQAVSVSSKQVVDNTRRGFSGFWTLTPKPQPQLPQTRYCYQMQADIVCYDVPQPQNIARLFGYQEGDNMSFIRQGGGSLGLSVPLPQDTSLVSSDLEATEAAVEMPLPTGPTTMDRSNAPAGSSQCLEGNGPFACKESPYVKPEPASTPAVTPAG